MQVSGCNNLSSNISSWWGCFGNNCSNSSNNNQTTAGVNLPNTYPTLTINWQYDNRFFFNRCLGTADPRIHKLVIKNTGTGNARNISVLLHNMLYNYGMVGENYLDTTNIKIQRTGCVVGMLCYPTRPTYTTTALQWASNFFNQLPAKAKFNYLKVTIGAAPTQYVIL